MTTINAVLVAELERLKAAVQPTAEYVEDLTRHAALGEKALEAQSAHMRERFASLFQPIDADLLVAANAEVVRFTTELAAKQERNKRLSKAMSDREDQFREERNGLIAEIDKLNAQLAETKLARAKPASEIQTISEADVGSVESVLGDTPAPEQV